MRRRGLYVYIYIFAYSQTQTHRQTQHTDTTYTHSAREKGETCLVLYMVVVFICFLLLFFLRSIESDRSVEEVVRSMPPCLRRICGGLILVYIYIWVQYPFISLDISFGLFRYIHCCD
jgi:hypothetical protein